MKILQGILSESEEYYSGLKKKIEKRLFNLPAGSIKERRIFGKRYYYLQYRKDKKIIQKYLGKVKPEAMLGQIKERNALKAELKKVNEALHIIGKSVDKRHD
ncbi:MAG: hypothetical protein PHO03_05305 [Candidatus Omnitrophica bacterium]|nr:hypothetical protein [Candidatus Omnitrophota bacterium]